MNPNQRYRLNEPTVIQEVIEGEAIIADLSRGFYYSLDSLGSKVWDALVNGSSAAEIVVACRVAFPADSDVIEAGIDSLLDALLNEQLIVPDAHASPAISDAGTAIKSSVPSFIAPVLSKYTDMEQLLLLDPIHEVDETGWPNEPDDGDNNQ